MNTKTTTAKKSVNANSRITKAQRNDTIIRTALRSMSTPQLIAIATEAGVTTEKATRNMLVNGIADAIATGKYRFHCYVAFKGLPPEGCTVGSTKHYYAEYRSYAGDKNIVTVPEEETDEVSDDAAKADTLAKDAPAQQ